MHRRGWGIVLIVAASAAGWAPMEEAVGQEAPTEAEVEAPARPFSETYRWGGDSAWMDAPIDIERNVDESFKLLRRANLKIPKTRVEGLSDPAMEAEKEYTYYWASNLLSAQYTDEKDASSVELVPRIDGKDDGAVLEFRDHRIHFRVVDERALHLFVLAPRERNWTPFECFVHYCEAARIGEAAPGAIEVFDEKEGREDKSVKYGRFRLRPKYRPHRLDAVVEWYRQGDVLVFSTQKRRAESDRIANFTAEEMFGGLPLDDPRTWRRFKDPNRKQLAEELYQASLAKKKDDAEAKKTAPATK